MNHALVIDKCCLGNLRCPHISNLSIPHSLSTRLIIVSNHDVVLVHVHVHEHTGVIDVTHHVTNELSTTVVQTVGDEVESTSQFS